MPETRPLPTIATAQLSQLSLRASLEEIPVIGKECDELRLYYYAVTQAGWSILRNPIQKWLRPGRKKLLAFVGTDHGITEPAALTKMQHDGVDVRLLTKYAGVYHPKVVWLFGRSSHFLWIGSNNLTGEGFGANIEFAALLSTDRPHPDLLEWAKAVEASSEPLTNDLLDNYDRERTSFAKKDRGTFTWSRRETLPPVSPRTSTQPSIPEAVPPVDYRAFSLPHAPRSGDLVIEIMPRETGTGGSQIQLPIAAISQFFGLKNTVGSSLSIVLRSAASGEAKSLTMTVFGNRTVRLSLSEVDYTHRPCLIHFYRAKGGQFSFQIVQRAVYPQAYRHFLKLCSRTRIGSRGWVLLP